MLLNIILHTKIHNFDIHRMGPDLELHNQLVKGSCIYFILFVDP